MGPGLREGWGGCSSLPPLLASPQTTAASKGRITGFHPTPDPSPLLLHTERVREELRRELGAGRAPSLGDRARLPYTDAVLHEAQRLLALVPMGMPHALTRTTCFRGYILPQVGLWTATVQWLSLPWGLSPLLGQLLRVCLLLELNVCLSVCPSTPAAVSRIQSLPLCWREIQTQNH